MGYMDEQKKHFSVTAAVIVDQGRILLARRPPGDRHAGWWEFPGGKQEPGESLEECLAREIREELGLEITDLDFLMAVDHDYQTFSLTLSAYFCRPAAGAPVPAAADGLAWVRPERLGDFDLLPPDRIIARALGAGSAGRGRP